MLDIAGVGTLSLYSSPRLIAIHFQEHNSVVIQITVGPKPRGLTMLFLSIVVCLYVLGEGDLCDSQNKVSLLLGKIKWLI